MHGGYSSRATSEFGAVRPEPVVDQTGRISRTRPPELRFAALLIGEPHAPHPNLGNLHLVRPAAEKGIQEIVAITFAPPSLRANKRNVLEVTIVIRPADAEELLTIAVTLGG
jgi:hypothetical protein